MACTTEVGVRYKEKEKNNNIKPTLLIVPKIDLHSGYFKHMPFLLSL